MTIWPTSFPRWCIGWTSCFAGAGPVGEHRPLRGGKARWAALPSALYHSGMMVKVLLYGYCIGVVSSQRISYRFH